MKTTFQNTEIIIKSVVGETPFKIRRTTDWLLFKVSTGFVIVADEPIIPGGVETTIAVDSGVAEFWFYVDVDKTNQTAALLSTATTPMWSCTKIPVGWVDTSSGVDSYIHQFLYDNIFAPRVV